MSMVRAGAYTLAGMGELGMCGPLDMSSVQVPFLAIQTRLASYVKQSPLSPLQYYPPINQPSFRFQTTSQYFWPSTSTSCPHHLLPCLHPR